MTDLTGKTIGGYKVARKIAEGSMGAVWIARDPANSAWLALKTISTTDLEYNAQERFLREIESLQRVEHDNVVQLVDYGWDDTLESPFMVMEMVHGDPVSRLVEHGRLPENLAAHIAINVCNALVRAHEQGVIHRDIKPANLMVRPRQDSSIEVKVLDFGLAFLGDEEMRLTRKGTSPGTVLYTSPEQLRGEVTDGRADLYSLGICLFEMVAGTPPFSDRNLVNVAHMHFSNPPPPLRKRAPNISADFAELVSQLLEKEAKNRPADAATVAQRLLGLDLAPPRADHRGPAMQDVAREWSLLPRQG